jgi:hypothetical protein
LKFHGIEIALLHLLTFGTGDLFIGRKMSKGPLIQKSQDVLNVRAALATCRPVCVTVARREEHRLGKIFGPERDNRCITDNWIKLSNEKIRDLYSSDIKVIKSITMR